MSAATVALVARASVSVEASPAYLQLSRKRLGMEDLDAWLGKNQKLSPGEDVSDLPLLTQLS